MVEAKISYNDKHYMQVSDHFKSNFPWWLPCKVILFNNLQQITLFNAQEIKVLQTVTTAFDNHFF